MEVEDENEEPVEVVSEVTERVWVGKKPDVVI